MNDLLHMKPASVESRNTLIYVVFILLGMATLFPWNAFLNAYSYFAFTLANTPYEFSYMSYVSTAYTGIMLAMMVGMVIFQIDQKLILTQKAFFGLGSVLTLITAMTVIPLVEVLRGSASIGQMTFFWSVLAIVSGTAVGTSMMMGSFYTLISVFPPRYVPAFNAGQALAGVLVSLVSLISSLASSQNQSPSVILKSTVFYFSASTLVLVFTLVGFFWLTKQRIYRVALEKLVKDDRSIKENIKVFGSGTRIIWDLAIGVMMVLAVTISIITSYVTSVKSSGSGTWASVFLSVVFVTYNLGDLAGRWLPAFKIFTFRRRSRKPAVLPWLRLLLFTPLFIMSSMNGTPAALRKVLPVIIKWDWLYLLLTFFFGLTSGFCCTLLMMVAPDQTQRRYVEDLNRSPERIDAAKGYSGTIMGLFINIGLMLGSLGSFLLRALI